MVSDDLDEEPNSAEEIDGMSVYCCAWNLDGITFDEIILTVHCNCRNITQETVTREVNDLVSMRLDDMRELLMRNIDIIMSEAKKGRGDYENT